MGTISIFLKPSLSNLLFTGPGRGLASCLAIDCLYSLNGGQPGFALRKWDQEVLRVWPLEVLLSIEHGLVSLAVYNYFLTRVSFQGGTGEELILYFLFTGPGRGLALCLAIGCLYSLNGGWPGFDLRKSMQIQNLLNRSLSE